MKNTQKGSVNVWLVAIIVVLLIIIGYFAFIRDSSIQDKQPNSAPKPVPVSTVVSQTPQIPLIRITSPNGGEMFKIGNTYTVTFVSTGDLGSKTIRLNRYSDDGVRVGAETIGTTNADTFAFKVPVGTVTTNGNAGRYKIQVIVDKYASGKGMADESDDYFAITQ